jgi:hypothetical protein
MLRIVNLSQPVVPAIYGFIKFLSSGRSIPATSPICQGFLGIGVAIVDGAAAGFFFADFGFFTSRLLRFCPFAMFVPHFSRRCLLYRDFIIDGKLKRRLHLIR